MDKKTYPSDMQERFMIRLPDGMRARIAELAKANNRSMNAEIVQRLEWALSLIEAPASKPAPLTPPGDLPFVMKHDINQLAHEANVTFDEMLARIVIAGMHPSAPQVLYLPITPGATMQDLRTAMEASRDFVLPDATVVSEKVTYAAKLPPKGSVEVTDPLPETMPSKRITRPVRKTDH